MATRRDSLPSWLWIGGTSPGANAFSQGQGARNMSSAGVLAKTAAIGNALRVDLANSHQKVLSLSYISFFQYNKRQNEIIRSYQNYELC